MTGPGTASEEVEVGHQIARSISGLAGNREFWHDPPHRGLDLQGPTADWGTGESVHQHLTTSLHVQEQPTGTKS